VTWFVRHGESTWNASGVVQGQRNEPALTASGRRQIRCLGHELIAAQAEIECIVSSDLDRARQSASILARQLLVPVVLDRRLRERSFGSLEGTPRVALPDGFDGIVDGVIVDPDVRPGGGETLGDVLARVGAFIEDGPPAGAPWSGTLVVAHGGPVRMAAAWALDRPLGGLEWSEVPNAALVAVPLSDPGVAVPGHGGPRSRVAV
jgi:2,3-bisphosphoglycerate-dependent phosphoglycerate mutase